MEEGERQNIRNSMMAAYKAVMVMVMVMVMVGLSRDRDQLILGHGVPLTDGWIHYTCTYTLHVKNLKKQGFTGRDDLESCIQEALFLASLYSFIYLDLASLTWFQWKSTVFNDPTMERRNYQTSNPKGPFVRIDTTRLVTLNQGNWKIRK